MRIATFPGSEDWPVVEKSRAVILRQTGQQPPPADDPLAKYEMMLCRIGSSYLLPGGGREAEETSREAVLREVEEEVGVRPQLLERVVLAGRTIELEAGVPAFCLEHLQSNYVSLAREWRGNRKVKTDFWFAALPDPGEVAYRPRPTQQERDNGLKAGYYSFAQIERILSENRGAEPRSPFTNDELRGVVASLRRLLHAGE